VIDTCHGSIRKKGYGDERGIEEAPRVTRKWEKREKETSPRIFEEESEKSEKGIKMGQKDPPQNREPLDNA